MIEAQEACAGNVIFSPHAPTVPGPVSTNEQEFVVRLLARLTVRGCARSAEEPGEQSSF
jgi:hypothetical protein